MNVKLNIDGEKVKKEVVGVVEPSPESKSIESRPNPKKVKAKLPKNKKRKMPKQGEEFNEIEDVMFKRRSIRVFREKQVPEYIIRRILETGRYAPSAGNSQSWRFVVIRDPDVIHELTEAIIRQAIKLSRLVDYSLPNALTMKWVTRLMMRLKTGLMHPTGLTGLQQVAKRELGVWHGAPTVILLLSDTRGVGKPHLDLGIAGTNMDLAAHSMGLGSCWVSFASLLEYEPALKKKMGIDYPFEILSSLSIGYPRGIPDDYVERETHETPWFEDGECRTVF
ncbi:MAG: nitroreductase family protein [Pseudomonadales bacterium]|nr:nitroreductase family protein [Pseudomonadales bacterium]